MQDKQSLYLIKYFFDGVGRVRILADNEEDAEEKFLEGDFDPDDDCDLSENYCIEEVIKITE